MKLEFYLPGPPSKLGTNARRRAHWADINDLTERCHAVYTKTIKEQLKKNYPDIEREGIIPCFEYASVIFTLVAPNYKVPDPDNMSGMCKPVLDCLTVRNKGIPLLFDDKGQYMEVTYRIRKGNDKTRSPWLWVILETSPIPKELSISPNGIGKNTAW